MAFCEHGQLKTEWFDNVLLVSPYGSINVEAAVKFNKQVESSYADFKTSNNTAWFRIEFFMTHETLFTPGVIHYLRDSLKFAQQNNCQHLSIVGGNLCAREIASKCGKDVGLPWQRFDTLEAFCDLLNSPTSLFPPDISVRIVERLKTITPTTAFSTANE
jgi:hypothetical protein